MRSRSKDTTAAALVRVCVLSYPGTGTRDGCYKPQHALSLGMKQLTHNHTITHRHICHVTCLSFAYKSCPEQDILKFLRCIKCVSVTCNSHCLRVLVYTGSLLCIWLLGHKTYEERIKTDVKSKSRDFSRTVFGVLLLWLIRTNQEVNALSFPKVIFFPSILKHSPQFSY